MKKYYESSSVREADRIASEELGIPGIALMENAGRGAAETLLRRYPHGQKFLILCGPGNNGGDGFVVARHLSIWGRTAAVVCTMNLEEYKGDSATAALCAKNYGINIVCSSDLSDDELSELMRRSDVIVDALIGTGSSGAPRGEVGRLVLLCDGRPRIVSLDVPSGVDPDTGEVYGTVLTAEMTITFLAEKVGLAVAPGYLHSGEVEVCGIGASPDRVLRGDCVLVGYDSSDIPKLRPKIPKDIYKGARGALLVVGGSSCFRGAPVLAAMGALRAGCGLVFLAIPDFMAEEASSILPEAIFLPLPTRNGFIRYRTLSRSVAPWFEKCDAMVLGPGLGRSRETELVTGWLCREWKKPLLIDADALHNVANIEKSVNISSRKQNVVITPHHGEAASLLGTDSNDVAKNRLSSGAHLSDKFGTVLLKGPHTLICGDSVKRVILEGGPQLAIPGSGDVLSGVIGAFLASGMSCVDAATLGALVHGSAGNMCPDGVLARELAEKISTSV